MAQRKTRWQQPAESSGGQSSIDAWEHAKPEGKWTEVSADYKGLEALVTERKITWTKSGRESAKREAGLVDMLEKAATNEKREGRDRISLGTSEKPPLQGKKRKTRQRVLIEEMRKNVVAAQQKSFEAEQSLCNALRECVDNNGRDQHQARAEAPRT